MTDDATQAARMYPDQGQLSPEARSAAEAQSARVAIGDQRPPAGIDAIGTGEKRGGHRDQAAVCPALGAQPRTQTA